MPPKSRLRGMTLIEVMIASGLMMGLVLAVMSLFQQVQKANSAGTAKATAQEVRRNLLAMLEAEGAWFRTFNDERNRTFECLRKHRDCHDPLVDEAKVGLPYVVLDTASGVFFDGLDPKAGYTAGGVACRPFPSRACPLRPELTWKPLCASDKPCHPVQIELSARVLYDPGSDAPPEAKMAYNPDNYSFRMYKNLLSSGFSTGGASGSASDSDSQTQEVDEMSNSVEQQKAVFCNQVAPMIRGQSPEAVKQTMRNLGYSDEMYAGFMKTIEQCP